MPWCDGCSRYWTPSSADAQGTCPSCGRALEVPERQRPRVATVGGEDGGPADGAEDQGAPWHFKLLVVAVVAYLGWRLLQVLGWLVERL